MKLLTLRDFKTLFLSCFQDSNSYIEQLLKDCFFMLNQTQITAEDYQRFINLFSSCSASDTSIILKGCMELAAAKNNIQMMKLIHSMKPIKCDSSVLLYASINGHSACLRFANETWPVHQTALTSMHLLAAVESGDFDCVHYVLDNLIQIYGVECYNEYQLDSCIIAAELGHYEILKFLIDRRFDISNPSVCEGAAMEGYLDCLRLAYEHGSPLSLHALEKAALNNHFRCFEFIFFKIPIHDKNLLINGKYFPECIVEQIHFYEKRWRCLLELNCNHLPILQNRIDEYLTSLEE